MTPIRGTTNFLLTALKYQLANLVSEGRLKPVVETTLPLADAARAHEMVEGGHVGGKVVLVVENGKF